MVHVRLNVVYTTDTNQAPDDHNGKLNDVGQQGGRLVYSHTAPRARAHTHTQEIQVVMTTLLSQQQTSFLYFLCNERRMFCT